MGPDFILSLPGHCSHDQSSPLYKEKLQGPMTHRAFLEEQKSQLCNVTVLLPPTQAYSVHFNMSQKPMTKEEGVVYGHQTYVHARHLTLEVRK